MADLNSFMTIVAPIRCTRHDYETFQAALNDEKRRQEDDELGSHEIKCDYNVDGLLLIYSDCFGDDDVSDGVCNAMGRLATASNCPFLEFKYSQWMYGDVPEGGAFRIYGDGHLAWPSLDWD